MRISDWSADVCSSDLLINLKAAQALYAGSGEASFSALTRAQPQGPDLDNAIRDSLARLIAAVEAQPDSLVAALEADRKSVVSGKRVSDSVDLGDRRYIKKTLSYKIGSHYNITH